MMIDVVVVVVDVDDDVDDDDDVVDVVVDDDVVDDDGDDDVVDDFVDDDDVDDDVDVDVWNHERSASFGIYTGRIPQKPFPGSWWLHPQTFGSAKLEFSDWHYRVRTFPITVVPSTIHINWLLEISETFLPSCPVYFFETNLEFEWHDFF